MTPSLTVDYNTLHKAFIFALNLSLWPLLFCVQTVKMRAQFVGTWLLHCHVSDHLKGGMEALYTVREKGEQRLTRAEQEQDE